MERIKENLKKGLMALVLSASSLTLGLTQGCVDQDYPKYVRDVAIRNNISGADELERKYRELENNPKLGSQVRYFDENSEDIIRFYGGRKELKERMPWIKFPLNELDKVVLTELYSFMKGLPNILPRS